MGKRSFRICVAGRLADDFAAAIDPDLNQEETEAITSLSGEFFDQAQFRSLLDRLSNLGIPVVRFETYSSDSTEGTDADLLR